jgi:hypothetical protein
MNNTEQEWINGFRLIKTRRSCIGCGLRPGALHSNGLCAECQTPRATPYTPVGNED